MYTHFIGKRSSVRFDWSVCEQSLIHLWVKIGINHVQVYVVGLPLYNNEISQNMLDLLPTFNSYSSSIFAHTYVCPIFGRISFIE